MSKELFTLERGDATFPGRDVLWNGLKIGEQHNRTVEVEDPAELQKDYPGQGYESYTLEVASEATAWARDQGYRTYASHEGYMETTMEELAYPKMEEILFNNGLQITLKIMIESLEKMIKKRGPSIEGIMVLEGLKGLYAGYMRRHEEDEHE